MPHVIVKMYAGRAQEQKAAIADALATALMQVVGSSSDSISVAIEDVMPADWFAQVYGPEIEAKPEQIFKKPGHGRR